MASAGSSFGDLTELCLALQSFLPVLVATIASFADAFVHIGRDGLTVIGAWALLRRACGRRKRRRGS